MLPIDPQLTGVLDAHLTCEFSTLGRDGTPLTWPIAVLPRPDGTLLATTSVAFPQKALNIRRDGRVALLFSDPTGSGLTDPPEVFVSGRASWPDEIVTSPAGVEEYWARLFERQPSSRPYVKTPINKLMDWYYFRLLITIEPDNVVVREPVTGVAAGPGTGPSDGGALLGADVLGRFPTAVLGAVDAAGAPLLMRTTVAPVAGGFEVRAAPDAAVVAGPASLLVHQHDEKLSAAYTALVPGRLSELGGGRWLLVPDRVIEPIGSGRVADALHLVSGGRRATTRYLDRRGLKRPRVPWGEYRKLIKGS
jgi:Pyridoxamine 5'-phosphate oxidase